MSALRAGLALIGECSLLSPSDAPFCRLGAPFRPKDTDSARGIHPLARPRSASAFGTASLAVVTRFLRPLFFLWGKVYHGIKPCKMLHVYQPHVANPFA